MPFLFLEAYSFPRASLSENCLLLGTDKVCGQICESIFAPNEGYCLFIILEVEALVITIITVGLSTEEKSSRSRVNGNIHFFEFSNQALIT